MRVYLDHNATTPLHPEAAQAMVDALALVGNPSSVHAEGRAARKLMEAARFSVAGLVNAKPDDVTFTSGATEALNLALTPDIETAYDRRPVERLLIGAVEHAAVMEGHRFPADRVEKVPVTPDGVLDLSALAEALDRLGETRAMLALQTANNETGVVQPVAEAAAMVHGRGGVMVVDAVQSAGRLPTDLGALGADLLVVSAHKLGGPAGVGALVRASDAIHFPRALVRGGGQERGSRGGTENVAGISSFGVAARIAAESRASEAIRQRALRDHLEAGLIAVRPDLRILAARSERLPNTSAVLVPNLSAETALIALDLAGLAVSSGAACSSGRVKSSHVLDAMGVAPDLNRSMIRFSLGSTTRMEDIERALVIWVQAMTDIRLRSAA